MSISNKVGRPTELTPMLQEEICDLLSDAVNIETVCGLVGISKATYYNWRERGESGEEPFAEFLDATTRARAKAKLTLLRIIDRAAENGDWRAASWRLTHGGWPEFSDRPALEKKTTSLPPEAKPISDEELLKILANLPSGL